MDHPPSAWITGAAGLIGNALVDAAPDCAPGWRILPLARADLDLTDASAVEERFSKDRPGLIIHCAAMSQTPACTRNPEAARQINLRATQRLARLARDIPFVFFSTDLVFDGQQGNYVETDPPNPLSVYGETKLRAEDVVLSNPRHLVLRTSLNYGTSRQGDRSFNEQMWAAWNSGKIIPLFVDEFRCPIPVEVTVRAVWELVIGEQTGLLHLAGAERLSRHAIGCLLAQSYPGAETLIRPERLAEYQGAPRSPDTSLNCDRVKSMLSFPLPSFSEWLRQTAPSGK